MYTVLLSAQAERYICSLPKKDHDRLLKRINGTRTDPFRYFFKLRGSTFWRLRVGDYRVIVDIIIVNQKIFVVRVGNRKNVYD